MVPWHADRPMLSVHSFCADMVPWYKCASSSNSWVVNGENFLCKFCSSACMLFFGEHTIFYFLLRFFSNPLSLSEASYILWPVGIYTCSQASKPKRCGKAKEKIWGKVVDWHWDFHGEGWQVQMSYCEAVMITIDCFSCYLQILWKCTDKYEGIWRTLQLLLAI